MTAVGRFADLGPGAAARPSVSGTGSAVMTAVGRFADLGPGSLPGLPFLAPGASG
jgi:hypothetical protein